ncbi:SIR2 family protein [Edaphovirga cremea]|uniref:SIR2 family protein n=1 Tax=Edaphovirga cremea TaxID=2267246 RepID=UPI00398A13C0
MKLRDLHDTMLNKKRSLKDLASYIKTKSGNSPNYSLFLGAGASVTSGINSGTQLVDEWRKDIYELLSKLPYADEKKAKEYLLERESSWYEPSNEYSSLFEKIFDLPSQRRRFVEQQVDGKLPSIGYSYLVSLFQSGYIDTVFTTNFDDLINEAFYQFSRERPTLCAHDSSIRGVSVNSSRPKIIKLHGDYLFDSIKSTLNETESLEINTKDKLIEFTKKFGLIFLGYAGNDRSIMDVINHLLRQDEFLGNGIYWCFRAEDEINPDLQKILQREKVYYVEIDGFDQALAEIHYHINGHGLSLEANFKSTKRDTILSNFIEDNYKLSSNEFISKDIDKLKTHTNKLDISNLINELSDENFIDGKNITEVDLKNLLFLDNLIKDQKLDEAEKEAEKLFHNSVTENLKKAYISRLVTIFKNKEQYDQALLQIDKLLEMDEFSIRNNLKKSSLFKNPLDRMNFCNLLVEKFKYSYLIKNEYAKVSLNYRSSKHFKNDSTYSSILEKLNESLKLEPSLDNPAWRIKSSVLTKMKESSGNIKEYKEEIEKIISKMIEINTTHINTLKMRAGLYKKNLNIEQILELINELNELYETSSHSKKNEILSLLVDIHKNLNNFKKREIALKASLFFLEKYSHIFEKEDDATHLLFRAEHLISYDRDIHQAKDLAAQAIEARGVESCAEGIANILCYGEVDKSLCDKLMDKIKGNISEKRFYSLKAQILIDDDNYEEALIFNEKALSSGLDYRIFLTNYSYICLCVGAYQKVINMFTANIDLIENSQDKDVLLINREFANKKLGNKINKTEVRNVIARDTIEKEPTSICGFLILDEEVNAKRLINEVIINDFSYYYIFKKWPAIPNSFIETYSSSASDNIHKLA